jgi:torulene dioxygenase
MSEHRGPIELKVAGHIPPWAAGSLYRTGPGNCTVPDTKKGTLNITHWFDGLAHTHCFDIQSSQGQQNDATTNGTTSTVKVFYSSRRQSDEFVRQIKRDGYIKAITFGQRRDPCVGMFSKLMTSFTRPPFMENVNVTVNPDVPGMQKISKLKAGASMGKDDRPKTMILGTDASLMLEVDPKTMEPVQYLHHSDLLKDLSGQMGPAHGQYDPQTGDYFNVNMSMSATVDYRVFKVEAKSGKATVLAKFQAVASYMHSFFLSEHYVIVCVPVCHLALNGTKVVYEGSLLEAFAPFDKNDTCRWFIIDRSGKGVVGEFSSPAAFFFHSINAFEDKETGDILCDHISYADQSIITHFYYDILLNRNHAAEKVFKTPKAYELQGSLLRFRFPKKEFKSQNGKKGSRGQVPSAKLDLDIRAPHTGDLPTMNELYKCKPYRYAYSLGNRGLSTLFDSITKVDLQTRDVLAWQAPQGHTPGEAIFVPRPAASGKTLAEDDGVLLTVVLDGHGRKSYLLCLDAKTMEELGRAECDFAVGFGFHGVHIAPHRTSVQDF